MYLPPLKSGKKDKRDIKKDIYLNIRFLYRSIRLLLIRFHRLFALLSALFSVGDCAVGTGNVEKTAVAEGGGGAFPLPP